MRPHKLVMHNFGPFEDTTVDFDQLGDEVYMIVGDTGVGKTMIFDGISFALYGKSSGDKRANVSLLEFLCRNAKEDAEGRKPTMKVELTFGHKGKEYLVTRELSWGSKGKAANITFVSTFSENGVDFVGQNGDKSSKPSAGKVSKKIEEILGLNSEDFKKIIMLAQGEFQKFLEATGKERNEILGRLYDNRSHIDLQNRLAVAQKRLSDRMSDLEKQMKSAMDGCTIPEGLSEEDNMHLDLMVEDPKDLFDALDKVAELLAKQQKQTRDEIATAEEKIARCTATITRAEQDNKLIKQKEALGEQKRELTEKASEYNALKEDIDTVTKAAKVIPVGVAYTAVVKNHGGAIKEGEKLRKEKTELEAREKESRSKAEQLAKDSAAELETLGKRITLLEEAMPVYEELEQAQKEVAAKERTVRELDAQVEKATRELQEKNGENDGNNALLDGLQEAGEGAVQAALGNKNRIAEKQENLNQVVKRARDLFADQGKLQALEGEVVAAEKATAEKQNMYDHANALARSCRAGMLADEMRKALETDGQVECPVCHTVHTMADVEHFAQSDGNVPDEAKVEELYQDLKKLRETEQRLHDAYQNKKGTFEANKQGLVKEIDKTLGEAAQGLTWESLAASAFDRKDNILSRALRENKQALSEAEAAYYKAVSQRDKKAQALSLRKELEAAIRELTKNKEELEKKQNQAAREKSMAVQRVQGIRERLQNLPESKFACEAEVRSSQQRSEAISKAIQEAKDAHTSISNMLAEVTGKVNSNTALVDKLSKDCAAAKAEYDGKVVELGFKDSDDIVAALTKDGISLANEEAATAWIEAKTTAYDRYKNAVLDVDSRIAENEKNTEGIVFQDLAVLNEELATYKRGKDSLDARSREEYKNLTNTGNNIRIIRDNMEKLIKLRRVENELKPMVDSTNNSKIKFKDYVLWDFFNQIVHHAAVYFEALMDNSYTLVADIPEVKSSSGNEEIRDLKLFAKDDKGNRSNIALLSGGQTFEASLALALGLSEVVQMQKSGKVRIESMFIDEGFGTLDGHRLDCSMKVLNNMAGQNRQIGIITHVEKLINADQYKKLEVTQKAGLSTVKFVNNN